LKNGDNRGQRDNSGTKYKINVLVKIDLEIICLYRVDRMPSPTYAQNKTHIMKWREKNIEKHLNVCRESMRKLRLWRKVKIEFLCILI